MPPLVVIRSGCQHIEYLENRSIWRRMPLSCSPSDSDDEPADDVVDGELLRQAEAMSNNHCDQAFGFSRERCDVEGMHAFRCADCGNAVADYDDVVSKTFFGRTGKAFLMNNMNNVRVGPSRNRSLMTGIHLIADVMCSQCDFVLGWKYLKALENSQKYKEGMFILEHAVVQDGSEEQAWNRL